MPTVGDSSSAVGIRRRFSLLPSSSFLTVHCLTGLSRTGGEGIHRINGTRPVRLPAMSSGAASSCFRLLQIYCITGTVTKDAHCRDRNAGTEEEAFAMRRNSLQEKLDELAALIRENKEDFDAETYFL